MTVKTLTRSFAGGELAEQLFGRLDLGKFQTGLAKCQNFLVTPQGPIMNRPGFMFVRATKNNGRARLIPFTFNTTQTLVIEMGAGYFRFHTDGATVLSAGAPYEVGHSYTESELFDVHYVQSGDVLTLVHPNHSPAELRRLGATNWTLSNISFQPSISAPGGVTLTTGGPGGGTAADCVYVTTAIGADTLEESVASVSATTSVDLNVAGNYVDVQPNAVTGAIRFNVYKRVSGLYGYVGQTDGNAFRDDNITPDVSKTPQLINRPFAVGAIVSVPVAAGGTGYGSTPLTGGAIDTVTLTAGGAGYVTPVASAAGGSGSGATFSVTEAAGVVDSITITAPGSLYESPVITITDGGGPGAGATATATATAIVRHNVTLSVVDGTGTGAVLEAVVAAGVITGVRVIDGGSGYTNPSVIITDAAGGTGANFSAPILTGSNVNPQAVGYFEQRRVFAGSPQKPQTFWMSRSGTESNMGYSIPTRDDDAITARAAAREADSVRHLVPLGDLLALTSGGVWRVAAGNGDVLTPANISVKPQGYIGASNAQPVTTSNAVLYSQARGARIRELSYSWQQQGYNAVDASILAPHLFDYHSIIQLAYSQAPLQTLWAVRDDGVLLGMSYAPEHEVKAWHQHTTQGEFESVAVVAEGDEDAVYVVVKRSIVGTVKRFVERMSTRNFAAVADSFFVDAGLTYDGMLATTISGLDHLEGATVSILADGGVHPPQVVSGGAVTLEAAARKVHIGLGYEADAKGMPLAMEAAAGLGQGLVKNIGKAWLRVKDSAGFKIGPTFDKLREYRQRTAAMSYDTAPPLITDVVPIDVPPNWNQDGSWCLRQSDPLPVTLLAVTLETATGG